MDSNTKLLIIYPHPDDEAFSCAGLIQKAIKANAQIKIVCLTKGEASTLKFKVSDNSDLAETREHEFKNVMKFLGVGGYEIGNFPDGKIDQNEDAVTQFVQTKLEEFQPNIVVTYEPSGIYGHPDHMFLSKVVTQLSKGQNFKLVYSTIPKTFKIPQSSLNMAKDKNKVKPLEPNLVLRLTPNEFIKKIQTLRLHKSQVSFKHDAFFFLRNLSKLTNEYFYTV